MPMVIHPHAKESVDSEIIDIAISNNGEYVAWSTYNGLFSIMSLKNNEKSEVTLDSYAKQIAFISPNFFIIGQEEGDVICFSINCEEVWKIPCPGGCELMESTKNGDLISIIDGTNTLKLINSQGELLGQFSENELIGMTVNDRGSAISCWDDEGNLTVLDRNGLTIFKRPINSKVGERIITAKYTQNGVLLVSKESLDIPDEGEQHELEFWNPLGQKITSVGFNSKCVSITTRKEKIWAGLFSGEILLIENYNSKSIWNSEFSITSMIALENDVLIASWFYLYRIDANSQKPHWSFEHEGIIDLLFMSENEEFLVLGGNDRNDYTNASPLILLNPNSTPIWEEESDDEFLENENLEETNSQLYDDSKNELKDILGNEFEQYDSDNSIQKASMNDLMDAFNEEISQDSKENKEDEEDISLIEHLLAKDEKRNQPPVCNAGDDQFLQSEDDGSCVVLLDGSSSHDPDGYIRGWNWTGEDGRILASSSKLKLRLPIGTHRFTLTVTDDDGAMSTDSVSIIIR